MSQEMGNVVSARTIPGGLWIEYKELALRDLMKAFVLKEAPDGWYGRSGPKGEMVFYNKNEWQVFKFCQAPYSGVLTIRELCSESNRVAELKKWWIRPRDFGEIISNIHGEVSEAWEEYRNPHTALTEIYYQEVTEGGKVLQKPEGLPIEFADIFIRVGDYCEKVGIDLEQAIRIKSKFNEERPERHGGKLA